MYVRDDAASLKIVADTAMAIPGGVGLFTGFNDKLSHDMGRVAFQGFGSSDQEGIYVDRGNGLEKLTVQWWAAIHSNGLGNGRAQR